MSADKTATDQRDRFDALFQANHDAIWRYCVRRLGASDADDAAAEVFAVAWRRLDDMPGDERSRAWLYGVAYRVVGGRYRGRRRQALLAGRLHATQSRQLPATELEPAPSRRLHLLLEAFDGLSRTDREVLGLSTWDGLARDEIARVLGIKENAVDQRLHRARSRLKARFERLEIRTSHPETEEAPT